ncbi:MAG TPA: tetratricopeptide repeat protein, partial [Anaerolineales bacterium]|nr:tetratricopeptide repeat protein [Anaerolineales bacterium]
FGTPKALSPQSNLPVFPTPLIGRERELGQLHQLLCDPQCRLLTLVGPGGMGKTRLAVETASNVADMFANGVYFVPLASVNAIKYIVPMIADALGFVFQSTGRSEPKTQLFNYLKERQVLILTDNLEHLLSEPGIEVLSELLTSASQVKLLATSRESLGLQGEWVFEVHGLPIPESEEKSGAMQNTSAELFLQRARRAHVEFSPTPEDHRSIVRICQLVGGMPLGLELAAAWVRTLTCDEIASEIAHGMDFLSISARDIPARHRSMRAVFDHSWKLLSEEEQHILLRLSVFRGGFRREAAEQVAEATLTSLSTLVTKSLIRRSGAGRYDLHELIRQFAAEHFSERPQEQKTTQARHIKYYLTYFGQADRRLRSSAQRETIAELSTEMDNFRSAWNEAVTDHDFELLEGSIPTISVLIDTRGWFHEGLELHGKAIAELERIGTNKTLSRTDQITLAYLLLYHSMFETRLGQYEKAQAGFERSIQILRPLDEPRVLVGALAFFGNMMEFNGKYPRALELYAEGLEIAEKIHDPWFTALCRLAQTALSGVMQSLISPDVAHEKLSSIVADWRAVGDPRLTAIALNNLSWTSMKLGLFEEARATLEESITLSSSIGDRWTMGLAYRALGTIAQKKGEHARAAEIFRKNLEIFTDLGMRQFAARALAEMSRSVFELGDDEEAERGWREAFRIASESEGNFGLLEALLGLAALRVKRGDMELAYGLALLIPDHPLAIQDNKERAARLRAELEAQLTPTQVAMIRAHMQEKTFQLAAEQLLKQ